MSNRYLLLVPCKDAPVSFVYLFLQVQITTTNGEHNTPKKWTKSKKYLGQIYLNIF